MSYIFKSFYLECTKREEPVAGTRLEIQCFGEENDYDPLEETGKLEEEAQADVNVCEPKKQPVGKAKMRVNDKDPIKKQKTKTAHMNKI